jgi:hypothetical protein
MSAKRETVAALKAFEIERAAHAPAGEGARAPRLACLIFPKTTFETKTKHPAAWSSHPNS